MLQSRRKTSKIGDIERSVLVEDIPQISDMDFQTALTSEHMAGFG